MMKTHCLRVILMVGLALTPEFSRAQPIESASAANLLSLADGSIRIQAPEGAKIEQTDSGGVRITYTNESMLEKNPWLHFKKIFPAPMETTVISIQVDPAERPVSAHVWDEHGRRAFAGIPAASGILLTPESLAYTSSGEKFEGRVSSFSISMELESDPGEHLVEISDLAIE